MTVDQELAEVLGAAATDRAVPGAAAGVLLGDDVHVAGHGTGHAELPRPVTARTLFQVGSVSKTVTAAAVALLDQEGLLSFDDPVARHLPGLAEQTGLDLEAITLELALSHQSGFDGDHLFTTGGRDGLGGLVDARRLFDPGTGFSYSNAGFSLAGAVVEAVSGQRFDVFVRQRLLRPLGLRTACFRADEAITHDVAAPHWVVDGTAHVLRGGGWQPGWELRPVDWAAGGLVASLEDLLRWCRFQRTGTAEDGTVVLTPASLERLHTPVVTADRLDRIALDWFVRDIGGLTTLGHGGVTVGYVTDLLIAPEAGFAFVGLTNAVNGASVTQAVRRWALERFADVVERDPVPDPTAAPDLAPYLGTYESAFAVLTVTAGTAGTLVITPSPRDIRGWQPPAGPPVTSAFFAPDHLVSTDAAGPAQVVSLGPVVGGRCPWLQTGGRRALRIV